MFERLTRKFRGGSASSQQQKPHTSSEEEERGLLPYKLVAADENQQRIADLTVASLRTPPSSPTKSERQLSSPRSPYAYAARLPSSVTVRRRVVPPPRKRPPSQTPSQRAYEAAKQRFEEDRRRREELDALMFGMESSPLVRNRFSFANAVGGQDVAEESSSTTTSHIDFADMLAAVDSLPDSSCSPDGRKAVENLLRAAQNGIRGNGVRESSCVLQRLSPDCDAPLFPIVLGFLTQVAQGITSSQQTCSMLVELTQLVSDCGQIPTSCLLEFVNDVLVQFIIDHLQSVEAVRKQAFQSVGQLLDVQVFSHDSLIVRIVPQLFALYETLSAEGFPNEESRTELASVLCRVVTSEAVTDRDWLHRHYVPHYSRMLGDRAFHIRKVAGSILGVLARLFGPGFTEAFIVPHVCSLSVDQVWGVRKVVCEVMVEIAKNTPLSSRRTVLATHLIRLLHDESRWVCFVAFQELGPFIATFSNAAITGLSVHNGKLCVASASASSASDVSSGGGAGGAGVEKSTDPYSRIPEGTYMPPTGEQKEGEDNDDMEGMLNDLTTLLNKRADGSRNSAPPSVADGECASGATTSSISAKCSSIENLHLVGLDEDESNDMDDEEIDMDDELNESRIDYREGDEEQEEGGAGPAEQEQKKEKEKGEEDEEYSAITYWQSETIFDIDDDGFTSFGASVSTAAPRSARLLEKRLDMLYVGSPIRSGDAFPAAIVVAEEEEEEKTADSSDMDISVEGEEPQKEQHVQEQSPKRVPLPDDGIEEDSFRLEMDLDDTADMFEGKKTALLDDTLDMFGDRARSTGGAVEQEEEEEAGSCDMDISDGGRAELHVPRALIDAFVTMVTPSGSLDEEFNSATSWLFDEKHVEQMREHCAHNLPAVAYTLGGANWEMLRDVFIQLSRDHQWLVRVSLANSIHLLATIVGEKRAVDDLLPVFTAFGDDIDEVRVGLLKHLFEFTQCLPSDARASMLQRLPQFMRIDNESNWRVRWQFAKQCVLLLDLYSVDEVLTNMVGMAFTLANDRVAAVRAEAVVLMARMIGKIAEAEWTEEAGESSTDRSDTPKTDALIRDVVATFVHTKKWTRRQTFANVCQRLRVECWLSERQFAGLLLHHLLSLADDAVPNVRVCVARALDKCRMGAVFGETTAWNERTAQVLECLCGDGDMDVSERARASAGVECVAADLEERARRIRDKEDALLDTPGCRDNYDSADMSIDE